MITLEQIKRHCSTDPGRPTIHQPWTRDGYTYATDGHTAIRVPAIDGVAENLQAPDAATLFSNLPPVGLTAVRLADLTLPEQGLCPTCEGGAIDRFTCEECNGLGEVICRECDNHTDCDECEGKGRLTVCPTCEGAKIDPKPLPVEVNGVWFDARFLRRFVDLPNARFEPMGLEAAPVEFDGGLGAIMPRRGP